MLTLSQILKVSRMESQYGTNDGSCFGVTDSSRLRQPLPISIPIKKYDEFKDGKKYFDFFNHWSNFMQIGLIDRELCQGYKARVTYNLSGTPEAIEDWTKYKVPFCDLETKEIQYIVKTF